MLHGMELTASDTSKKATLRPRLTALFSGFSVSGKLKDSSVSRLVTDSRRVIPGCLFFAIRGHQTDGNYYIEEAIGRGAEVIVSDKAPGRAAPVPWVQVPDARIALAVIARRYYHSPDASVRVIGVTGTNGKTTVTMLAQYLLSQQERRCGLIGTVRYDIGERTLPSYRTTPESVEIFALLDQLRQQQIPSCAIEVSSHALLQERVHGMAISTAAFLNLTRDHIDYHGTMEQYFATKARLFDGSTAGLPKHAVIHADDVWGQQLLKQLPPEVTPVTFGKDRADFRATDVTLAPEHTRFSLAWPGGTCPVETDLLGAYNVSNVLAALAIVHAEGGDVVAATQALPGFPGVPGRMERVDGGLPFKVLVDYAHTDDALLNALSMLRDITPSRLLVVFGCGGNRDRTKRPLMTATVQQFADHAWATVDNPRREAITTIFRDMREGVSQPADIDFIDDRRRAISLALDAAREGDTVLIAGKGHETFQEYADTVKPFDDRQVARELIERKQLRHL